MRTRTDRQQLLDAWTGFTRSALTVSELLPSGREETRNAVLDAAKLGLDESQKILERARGDR